MSSQVHMSAGPNQTLGSVSLPGEKLTLLRPNVTSNLTNKLFPTWRSEDDVTWEIRERSSLNDVLPVQGLQDLGAAEPLEADLHIVVIPFQRLRPKYPAKRKEQKVNEVKSWWSLSHMCPKCRRSSPLTPSKLLKPIFRLKKRGGLYCDFTLFD